MREPRSAFDETYRSTDTLTKDPHHPRRVSPWFVAALLQGCSQLPPSEVSDPALVGCWHAVKRTVEAADGTISEEDVDCTDETFASLIISQCLFKAGSGDRVDSTYWILRDGVIKGTVVAHPGRASDVGTVVEAEYKVEGDQMKVTVYPQAAKPHPLTDALRIETVEIRQAAPELCTPIGIRTFSPEKVIATVNGKPIIQANLDALIRNEITSDTLESRVELRERLIDDEVLAQEATRRKIPEADKISTDDAGRRFLIEALLRDEADRNKPSDAQLQAEYDRLRHLQEGPEYRIRHIMVATEAQARDIISRLDKGEDFAELAKGSIDTSSSRRGGDLGWALLAKYSQPFIDAIRGLKTGSYTSVPVRTPNAWHVIRLDDIRPVRLRNFDEVKSQIAEELQKKEVKAFTESLKANAAIVRF